MTNDQWPVLTTREYFNSNKNLPQLTQPAHSFKHNNTSSSHKPVTDTGLYVQPKQLILLHHN